MEIVKIKSIKKLDKIYDRYDLTISSTGNFFANGILIHNTSAIFGNVKIKCPAKLSFVQKTWNYLAQKSFELYQWLEKKTTQTWYEDYGNVYSSRGVIKNKYINKAVSNGFYETDIWYEFNELIKPYVDKGMMIYGEICGYLAGSEKMIQKSYDYGCNVGENFFMPYRITTVDEESGETKEWNIDEVVSWTNHLTDAHPELKNKIKPMEVLYHGTLSKLYPEIETNDGHWHENVLEMMKSDKTHFGMEEKEPLCKHKVPREGVCIRVDDKPNIKAMKLKSNAFYAKEQKSIDAGEVDMEMMDAYVEDDSN